MNTNSLPSPLVRLVRRFGTAALCAWALWAEAAPRTCTWTGGSGIASYWNYSANWSMTGGGSTTPQNGDDLVFPDGAARPVNTNNLPSRSFNSILIEGTGYTLRDMGTNAITLTNGVLVSCADAGSSARFELDINVIESQTFRSRYSYTTLYFTGNLELVGEDTILTLDTLGDIWLEGVISGLGGLGKIGIGVVYMTGSGHNSYTGPTRVNLGRLHLAKSGTPAIPYGELFIGNIGDNDPDQDLVTEGANYQIGDHVPITVYRSGWLDLNGHDDTVGALALHGGRVTTGVDPSIGTLTLGGNVTVHHDVSRAARMEGQIRLNATRTFQVTNNNVSPDLTISATITGSGDLVKTGLGALGLYADNTGYGGTVTVEEGLVYLFHDAALGSTAAGTVVTSGGVLALVEGRNIGLEPLTLSGMGDGASGALASGSGDNAWAGPITLTSDADVTVRPGSSLTLSGVIDGLGGLTKAQRRSALAQTGTLTLSGASDNTFAGDVYVDAGTLVLAKTSGDAVPNTLHVGMIVGPADSVVAINFESFQIGALEVGPAGVYNLDSVLPTGPEEWVSSLRLLGGRVITGNGLLRLDGPNVTVATVPEVPRASSISGQLHVGTGSRIFAVASDIGASPLLMIDAIVSGSAALIKEGAGTMGLAGANTFTGPLTINAGTVRVSNGSALGTADGGTTVNTGGELALVGLLEVVDEDLTFRSTGVGTPGTLSASEDTCSFHGDITLLADARFDADDASLALSGVIGGAGGFTKVGAATLWLGGPDNNTYGGTTRVHAGVVNLSKTSAIVAIAGDLEVGDGLGTDVVRWIVGSQIANHGTVTVLNSGRLELNDQIESIGALSGNGAVDLGSGLLEAGLNNASTTFDGTIAGAAGRLNKAGTGTLTLTGNNTYSGLTTVWRGTLLVNGTQPSSMVHVESAGTLGGTGTVGQITSTGTVAPGASPGVLTCGNLFLGAASAQLSVELNGTAAGIDHDQMSARGGITLSGAAESGTLRVVAGPSLAEGDQFMIIANDGAEGVAGTFAGLAEGAWVTAAPPNPIQFLITYRGGTGNDVVLVVTNTALFEESVAVLMGNGNGILDPNECNTLKIVLHNRDKATVTGIQTVLTTSTPGVWITQPESPYPDLPPGAVGTNTRPFQVSMAPDFLCGTDVQFALAVTTDAQGDFTILFELRSGCDDGSGPCMPCPNQLIHGRLAASDPQTQHLLVQNGVASACDAVKPCPGFTVLMDPFRYYYHSYAFQNGVTSACVTVELTESDAGVYSAAYRGAFTPAAPCQSYGADAGRVGPASYEFVAGARSPFRVVVAGPSGSDYTLRVRGGSCQPWLNIALTNSQSVVLSWPSFASDYHLDATNVVDMLKYGLPVPDPVFVIGRYCVCTNDVTPLRRFYQLRKP